VDMDYSNESDRFVLVDCEVTASMRNQ